jgi:sulfatase modifying factor 1
MLYVAVATHCQFATPTEQAGVGQDTADQEDMAYIPGGIYTPLFRKSAGIQSVAVEPFLLDRYAVTNRQFRSFTERNPQWSKGRIKSVFSDSNYLRHFSAQAMDELADRPVTNVSWFAARAYCKSLGKRLPSLDEWEFAARASDTDIDASKDPRYRQKILQWYSRPATEQLPNVQDTEANYWGVHGMHGVVWELVNDFNTALVTGESRGDSQLETQLFCGAGAVASADPGDYAAFMRYALRSSYQATYTMQSLGFRCAKDAPEISR